MSSSSAFSKHAQLIKKCYPTLPEEKGPKSSDLAYLVFYATSRPEKLVKVGAFLEKQSRSDLYHLHFEHVEVTLKILDTLIRECHKDVSLFSGNILSILSQALAIPKQPSLTRTTTQTFIRFCQCPDAHAALALDHQLNSTFIQLLDQYATYAKIPLRLPLKAPVENQEPEITLRVCGVKAMVSATLASLSAPDSRPLLRRGIPALLSNILPAQLLEGQEGQEEKDAALITTIPLEFNFLPIPSVDVTAPSSTTPSSAPTATEHSHPEDEEEPIEEKERSLSSGKLDPDCPLLQDPHCVLTLPHAIEYLSVLTARTFSRILTESSTVGVKVTVLNAFRSMDEVRKEGGTEEGDHQVSSSSTCSRLLALMLRSTRPANRFIVVSEIISQIKAASPPAFSSSTSSGSSALESKEGEGEGEKRAESTTNPPLTLLSSLCYLLQRGYSYAGVSVLELTDTLRPWVSSPSSLSTQGELACAQEAKVCLLLLGTQRTYTAQGAEVLSRLLSGVLHTHEGLSGSEALEKDTLSILSMAQDILQRRRDGVGARVMEDTAIPLLDPLVSTPLRLGALALIDTLVAPKTGEPPEAITSSSTNASGVIKGLQGQGEPDLGSRDIPFRSRIYARLTKLLAKDAESMSEVEYKTIWRILASFLLRFREEGLVEGFPWIHHLLSSDLEGKGAKAASLIIGWIRLAGQVCNVEGWVRVSSGLLKEEEEVKEEQDPTPLPPAPYLSSAQGLPPAWTGSWLVGQGFIAPSAIPPPWSARFIDLPALLLINPSSSSMAQDISRPSHSGIPSSSPRSREDGGALLRDRFGRMGSPGSGIGIR
ncbi:hypothetical protein BJ684DRAFT_21682, partial [Piptocephalis cylindrospora]